MPITVFTARCMPPCHKEVRFWHDHAMINDAISDSRGNDLPNFRTVDTCSIYVLFSRLISLNCYSTIHSSNMFTRPLRTRPLRKIQGFDNPENLKNSNCHRYFIINCLLGIDDLKRSKEYDKDSTLKLLNVYYVSTRRCSTKGCQTSSYVKKKSNHINWCSHKCKLET